MTIFVQVRTIGNYFSLNLFCDNLEPYPKSKVVTAECMYVYTLQLPMRSCPYRSLQIVCVTVWQFCTSNNQNFLFYLCVIYNLSGCSMNTVAVSKDAIIGGGGAEQKARCWGLQAATSWARTHAIRFKRLLAKLEHERPASPTHWTKFSRALKLYTSL